MRWKIDDKTLKLPLFILVVFYSVAFWRYSATGKIFYIYNFVYIGTSIALGIFLIDALPKKQRVWGRRISQLLIGLYMLGFVGFINHENMQIEGFFFYLLGSVFAGATLHYFLAKIVGVAIFNRGWCAWACWTAMVLDFLPWKVSPGRRKKLPLLRYLHFFLSLILVLYFWFILKEREIYNRSITELYWLVIGNLFYYISSITLAVILKDNRAFCKYLCPIPVLQRVLSRFSLLKVTIKRKRCTECGLCEKHCPMDIKLLAYKENNQRVLSTECIMCTSCSTVCPHNAIDYTFKLDHGCERFRYLDNDSNKQVL